MFERIVHWAVAATFVYVMLTGLALFWPPFFWLAGLFGGGPTIRVWHPIVGVIFAAVLIVMWITWARDLKVDREDREWLKHVREYATGQEHGIPEAARFNAGQKLLFYLQAATGVLLVLSGIVLWFPASFGAGLRQASFIVHDLSAIAAIGALILHIYMGVFVIRGSMEGMTQGKVSRRWAEEHHGRWYRALGSTTPRPPG
jgi:formate dehydrogenase subunit gamma